MFIDMEISTDNGTYAADLIHKALKEVPGLDIDKRAQSIQVHCSVDLLNSVREKLQKAERLIEYHCT